MHQLYSSLLSGFFFLLLTIPAFSQEEPATEEAPPWESLNWQTSGDGKISDQASIKIPAGYRFLESKDTGTLMEMFGNPLNGSEEVLIAPYSLDWFILFEFSDDGYVKDDEKDDIDADKLLKTIQSSDEPSNEHRRAAGYEELYTEGWAKEPYYNEETKSLEWGLILRSQSGGKSVNYITKRLGRRGVMNVTIVGDPEQLETILPLANGLLNDFNYVPGQTYAEFKEGDKLAKYGMTPLITGGALYGASKLGFFVLLKKFGKFIILGVVAFGVAFKNFFARLFGKKVPDQTS